MTNAHEKNEWLEVLFKNPINDWRLLRQMNKQKKGPLWTKGEEKLRRWQIMFVMRGVMMWLVCAMFVVAIAYLSYMNWQYPATAYVHEYELRNIGKIQMLTDRCYLVAFVPDTGSTTEPFVRLMLSGSNECRPLFIDDLSENQQPWLYVKEIRSKGWDGRDSHLRYDSIVLHIPQTHTIEYVPPRGGK